MKIEQFAVLLAIVYSLSGSETYAQDAPRPKRVSFSTLDGGTVYGDLYGDGGRSVVLVHGARFNKESWREQAQLLAKSGFRALAIDLRGYGESKGGPRIENRRDGMPLDVLAAVRYLRKSGAKSVSVIGGSMGGDAAANASVESEPGEIDGLILLAHGGIDQPQKMKGRKLFIVSRGDMGPQNVPRLSKIREQYESASDPKKLVVLAGSAHAQVIFTTDEGERLMREILEFLSE
jgi:pimeloyl-ACP methyl ester carboxylesterase